MSTNDRHKVIPDILIKILKWERTRSLIFAILSILGSLLCVLNLGKVNKSLGILLSLVALGFIVVTFRFLLGIVINWRTSNHPFVRLLKNDPERIVWIYSVITVSSPYGVTVFSMGNFYVKLNDREEICISAPPKQLKALSTALNPVLPHASFGFTPEKEQWYQADPALLYRSGKS